MNTEDKPIQIKTPQGDVYFGLVRAGKPHGKGTHVYVDGNVYEGMFDDGKRHGQGKMTMANGYDYEGTWN